MMISYAQNFEDVILSRALQGVENGFYIDVGANDPVEDSVTKHFYDKGWHGINIEPLKVHYDDLCAKRERDINLKIALGPNKGTLKIWESSVRGWSTLDAETAEKHESDGYKGSWHNVEVDTLENVFKSYCEDDIHFLKIDVEGFEAEVIKSGNFSSYRPWVIVVEVSVEEVSVDNHKKWEDILLENNYKYVYFDGLNRYYLSGEKSELAHFFDRPVCVHDQFIISQHKEIIDKYVLSKGKLDSALEQVKSNSKQLDLTSKQLDLTSKQLQLTSKQLQDEKKHSELLDLQLNGIYTSVYWRVTAPIRVSMRVIFGIIKSIKPAYDVRKEKLTFSSIREMLIIMLQNRYVKKSLLSIYFRLPSKLKSFIESKYYGLLHKREDNIYLTPRANEIYNELVECVKSVECKKIK